MSDDENLAEEVRKALSPDFTTNKLLGKLIAACVTLLTGIAGTMLIFIWELKSDVPLLKQGLINQEKNYSELQNSINGFRIEMQSGRDNQTRMQQKLEDIEQKIDNKNFK